MPTKQPKRDRTVTILDVARRAGVSPMTASRVMNGNPRVGDVFRERVLAASRELGYTPNLAGRSLRSSGTARIGFLYSNPSAAYLNEMMVGILEQSSQSGAQVQLEKCGGIQSQRAATRRLMQAGVDGVILPPPLCDSAATLRELEASGIPVVAIATGSPRDDVSSVRIDDYLGARAMTDYLLSLGHQRIALIKGDPSHTPARLREDGFRDAMRDSGLAVQEHYVVAGLFTYRSGLSAARQLLSLARPPSAIFCSNDDMAAAAMAVAHGLGLQVPEQLSIVGFDDTPVATTLWPELTTIHQPVSAMGRAAVSLMLEQVRARRSGRRQDAAHQLMKFKLVKRASSGPPG